MTSDETPDFIKGINEMDIDDLTAMLEKYLIVDVYMSHQGDAPDLPRFCRLAGQSLGLGLSVVK